MHINQDLTIVSSHCTENHGEAQVIAHRLAFDHFVSLVVFECERIFGPGPFVGDGLDVRECRLHSAMVCVAGVSAVQFILSVKVVLNFV